MLRQDEQLLAGLGYKQEFKRDFKPTEVFGFAFGLLGTVILMASSFDNHLKPIRSSHRHRTIRCVS